MSAAEQNEHWARQKERGSFLLMRFTVAAARLLGRRPLVPLLYLIVLYFYIFGRSARTSIHQYQHNLANWGARPDLRPSRRSVLRQFLAFADSLLDKLDVWSRNCNWSTPATCAIPCMTVAAEGCW